MRKIKQYKYQITLKDIFLCFKQKVFIYRYVSLHDCVKVQKYLGV